MYLNVLKGRETLKVTFLHMKCCWKIPKTVCFNGLLTWCYSLN